MNSILKTIFTFILLLTFSCSDSVTNITDESNLIINPSFEENGNPSLTGWFTNSNQSIDFSNDTPPNGGNWSITIESANFLVDFSQTVKIPEGNFRYEFSFWAKYHIIKGYAYLNIVKPDTTILIKTIEVSDTMWNHYTSIETINAESNDSLKISLWGGVSEIVPGKTYFDLFSLKKIE